jgi:hypothetical protein
MDPFIISCHRHASIIFELGNDLGDISRTRHLARRYVALKKFDALAWIDQTFHFCPSWALFVYHDILTV